jgi:BrnA antitoxin of type II toxin-antitoxin system
MTAGYDFSKMKSRRNPYASKLKKSVTIRLSEDVVDYFKAMASDVSVKRPTIGLETIGRRSGALTTRRATLRHVRRGMGVGIGGSRSEGETFGQRGAVVNRRRRHGRWTSLVSARSRSCSGPCRICARVASKGYDMQDEEPLAAWGQRWLSEWVDEATDPQDRETREWRAGHMRAVTLDQIVREWWHQMDGLDHAMTVNEVNNEWRLYVHERHALPVWRSFLHLRAEGEPIPEVLLAKFEQWGRRLLDLYRRDLRRSDKPDSELGRFIRQVGPLSKDDDKAALQLLELSGTRNRHVSFKRLRDTESRRRVASDIARLHDAGWPWKRIAARVGLNEQAAKDRYYEFVPAKRHRKAAADTTALATAIKRMASK